MSIVRKDPIESNKNLVKISKEEAVELQWKTIFNWKPQSDVWPFRYGIGFLGVSAAISSLYILSYYRRKLKLRHHARIAMNLPVASLPAVILPLLHQKVISEPILVQTACPVCVQVRSILLQNSVGVMYPMILAPLTGFMYSSVFVTYPLPLFNVSNAPQLFEIWKKLTVPFNRKLAMLMIVNTFIAAFVTEFEAKSFYRIQEKLISDTKI